MAAEGLRAVIIGGGQAGARAAKAMRDAKFQGSIKILGAEPHLPYERPLLSKALLKDAAHPVPFVFPAHNYDELCIEVVTDCMVERIDRDQQVVLRADGSTTPYDVLLVATGSKLREIAIPGYPPEQILALRTLDDCRMIEARLSSRPAVAVIGGGFIGLEVAATMAERGCQVSVIEIADRLLPRLGCNEASQMVLDHHRAAGIDIHLSTRIAGGSTSSLDLDDGCSIPADFAVVGVGVMPDTRLAEEAGLDVGDGILVDEFGRTSDPAIFAAGDVARHYNAFLGRHVRLESWQSANLQAETAGRAMAGVLQPYNDVPWLWSDQGALNLQMAGAPERFDRAILRGDPASGEGISVFQFRDDRLVGAFTVNRGKDMALIRRMLAQGAAADSLESLADDTIPLRRLVFGRA